MKLGKLVVKVDGDTQKELFKTLAETAEVFGETKCGLCGSDDIKPVVRVVGEDDFPEWHCNVCQARLSLGQNRKGGGLFPIRKLTENGKPDRATGKFGKHNGWTKYKGEPKKVE